MTGAVLVVGNGVWADQVAGLLSPAHKVLRSADVPASVSRPLHLALVLDDAWHPGRYREAEQVFRAAGVPWIPGFIAFGEGVVGPLVRPGVPGCLRCADTRRFMAGPDRPEMWLLEQQRMAQEGPQRDAWASRTGLRYLTYLCVGEAERLLGETPTRLEGALYLVNLRTLRSSRHIVVPDPLCPTCGGVPDDAPKPVSLAPTPKISGGYRSRPLDELGPCLVKDYLDGRTGLLNGRMDDLSSPFATVAVNLPLPTADEGTAGRTLTYQESLYTAILEGLERHCGLFPRGVRPVVFDSYRNLGDQALHPVRVGLHAPEQYARDDFPFRPFDPDRAMSWVWGYSFLQQRPILVPERLAYYSLGGGDGFVYETSNGCAVGGSLVEAIFHGILEVVERDAFLLTWYAQMPLPRIDLHSASDPELRLMVHRFEALTGYDLLFFNATMDSGIPSVWAIAKNRRREGANLTCAAGAHVDPVRAVKSVIHELAGTIGTLDERLEARREDARRMLRDPFAVCSMEDHSLLYSLPEAEERFSFLLAGHRPLQSFDEAFPPRAQHTDLARDLEDLLEVFGRLGLEVIVVDQTAPELQRNGLSCVKVLIPGMLPMTFGYHLTRLEGLHRVLNVPCHLGYSPRPLKVAELNPHPHPFP
ncbi:TOMM precursor leader peptide-binding protein [Alicyclobacillus macrosporangiidus]|uniref:TOMM precursor leader peptide-binding protein n=1 Tax=Alicyclobacillus macrosporangiidus TaxID=392015 RepID=UPI000494DDAE|nr:TOMM precursor leader peptide-binding protein [Alicyclobacillus macrosporangiidus]